MIEGANNIMNLKNSSVEHSSVFILPKLHALMLCCDFLFEFWSSFSGLTYFIYRRSEDKHWHARLTLPTN